MLKIGGGKLTLECNESSCSNTVSVDVIRGKASDTERKLMMKADSAGWDTRKDYCPDHK